VVPKPADEGQAQPVGDGVALRRVLRPGAGRIHLPGRRRVGGHPGARRLPLPAERASERAAGRVLPAAAAAGARALPARRAHVPARHAAARARHGAPLPAGGRVARGAAPRRPAAGVPADLPSGLPVGAQPVALPLGPELRQPGHPPGRGLRGCQQLSLRNSQLRRHDACARIHVRILTPTTSTSILSAGYRPPDTKLEQYRTHDPGSTRTQVIPAIQDRRCVGHATGSLPS